MAPVTCCLPYTVALWADNKEAYNLGGKIPTRVSTSTYYLVLLGIHQATMALNATIFSRRTGIYALGCLLLVLSGLYIPLMPTPGLRTRKAGRGGSTYIYEMDTHDGELAKLGQLTIRGHRSYRTLGC
jgi:hypothetical protein